MTTTTVHRPTQDLSSWQPAEAMPATYEDLRYENEVYVRVERGGESRILCQRGPMFSPPLGAYAHLTNSDRGDWRVVEVVSHGGGDGDPSGLWRRTL